MDIYLKLFEVLFPVFFVVGIGYYLGKKNPKIDTTFITNFAANVGTPAMIIYALTATGTSFEIFKNYFWYYLIAIIIFSLIGIVFLFLLNTKDIIRELPPFIMPNTGNMGLPICLFAYGSQGLGVAAAISALIILSHFTLGIFLAANVGTPAMIIYALTATGTSFEIFKNYFWYYFIAIIIFSLIGVVFLFLLNTKDIIRELPPFIMPNTGNMGLPICLFAYGSQGLGVAAAISALIILSHFTLGIFLAARKFNFDVILKSPPFYTIIISVFLLYFEIKTPVFIENTTFLLMYATIFLILMSLGIALTRFKVFSFKKALISSIGRVIAGPIVGFLLIRYFNLTGFAAGVLLIQCSMPSAVLNYLVASIYSPKKIIDSVASTIVVSTLMSFITIPIVVFFALKYFN